MAASLAALCLVGSPVPVATQGLDELAEMELAGAASGMALALYHEEELDFIDAWGSTAYEDGEELRSTHVFPFPGFTEVLLAATIRALHDAGQIDANRPLSRYLPELPEAVGRATLDQLLAHRGGLADPEIPPGTSYEEFLGDLTDEMAVVEPGLVYSVSSLSYPLAARVLERATRMPLTDVITAAVLDPLGMNLSTFVPARAKELGLARGYRMSDDPENPVESVPTPTRMNGLPVLYTAIPDLIQFSVAWMGGGIRGTQPVRPGDSRDASDALFRDGVWLDWFRTVPRARLEQTAGGFTIVLRLLPTSGTALVAWANGEPSEEALGAPAPWRSVGVTEDLLVESLGLPEPELLVPGDMQGMVWAPAGRWPGVYVNAGARVALMEDERGYLSWDQDGQVLRVARLEGNRYGAFREDGGPPQLATSFRLMEVEGRPILIMDDRVYARSGTEGGG